MKIASVQFELCREMNGTYSIDRVDAFGRTVVLSQIQRLETVEKFFQNTPIFENFIQHWKAAVREEDCA